MCSCSRPPTSRSPTRRRRAAGTGALPGITSVIVGVPCAAITIYIVILLLRAVFSWFPPPSGPAATVYRILMDLTEPVLAPLRRVIPPAGMFDLSFLVLIVALFIVQQAVCQG